MYKKTTLTIAVHAENENPVFGETSTHVSIEDLSGGPFIKIKQCNDEIENGTISFNSIEEMEAVFGVASALLLQFKEVEEDV